MRVVQIVLLILAAVVWTAPEWLLYLPGRIMDRMAYGRRKS